VFDMKLVSLILVIVAIGLVQNNAAGFVEAGRMAVAEEIHLDGSNNEDILSPLSLG